eukprot:10158272-Alexandrium_andersonii.AAC.1
MSCVVPWPRVADIASELRADAPLCRAQCFGVCNKVGPGFRRLVHGGCFPPRAEAVARLGLRHSAVQEAQVRRLGRGIGQA